MSRKLVSGFLIITAVSLAGASAVLAEDQVPPEQQQERQAGGANHQPSAEEVRQMMQGVMGPMMGEMMSSMIKSLSKTLAEPQIAQNYAAFTRNYYQALIDKGFTADEALKIVSSVGLPSVGGSK